MCRVDVPQRDIGAETRETLDARMDAMPRQFELDAQYQPLYALLGNRTLESTLFGGGGYQNYLAGGGGNSPAAPVADPNRGGGAVRTVSGMAPSIQQAANTVLTGTPKVKGAGAVGDTVGIMDVNYPAGDGGLSRNPPEGATTIPIGTVVTRDGSGLTNNDVAYSWNGTGWVQGTTGGNGAFTSGGGAALNQLPENFNYSGPGSAGWPGSGGTEPLPPAGEDLAGQAGLLDMMERGVTPALTRMQTSASTDLRNATMADVNRLAPGLRSNYDAANPESAALRAQLNDLASSGMMDGLTDYETRTSQQAARQAQSARGFGYGGNDAFDEAMSLALDTQQRREANRQFGLQVQGANNASAIDPWAAITGQSSLGAGAAAAGGFYRPPAGTQFDPFNAYSGDLFSSNQNAAAAESQANNILGNFASNL